MFLSLNCCLFISSHARLQHIWIVCYGHLTENRLDLDISGKVSGKIKEEQVRSRLCKKNRDQERSRCNRQHQAGSNNIKRVHVRKVGSEKINAEHVRSRGSKGFMYEKEGSGNMENITSTEIL